ncbi:SUMF1/EgtB/PvdO family nonheme iron enzyme [Opitutales bacterium]|nr:SUMF1/EgtB/PvdO family nonheme iron enzyme [Opitutales bacterium]
MKPSLRYPLSFLLLFGLASLAHAAPPILNYSGQVAVDGSPFTGTAYLKFAFVDGSGQFSYWSHDGTSANGSEPDGNVSVSVSGGLYSILIGDTQIAGMGEVDESVFQNHNDVHLRVWFSDGVNGFQQISPDRRFASVPYVLGNDGTGDANFVGAGTVNNSTQSVTEAGGYVRLVANGPDTPSGTLVLLNGDTAEVLAYVGEDVGLLEYSFGEHGFVLPKTFDSFRQTLIGPGSVRLVATTGSKSFANLRVHRANGRDHLDLDGGATSGSEPPAIVSIPKEQTVVLGGRTTLFVSASGDNLTYQWKKNGVEITGATNSTLSFEDVSWDDNGTYQVTVTNDEGNSTTETANLLILENLVRIPAGTYGIRTGVTAEIEEFLMDKYETRRSSWEVVKVWALENNYTFENSEGFAVLDNLNLSYLGGDNHPVTMVTTKDVLIWANARSEKEGLSPCYYTDSTKSTVITSLPSGLIVKDDMVDWNASGYRLPTYEEFVVAARGGLEGKAYPWGNFKDTSKANLYESNNFEEVAGNLYRKAFEVGLFEPNGYGLHDILGNVGEYIWFEDSYYSSRNYEYSGIIKAGFMENFSNNLNEFSLLTRGSGARTNEAYHGVGFRLVRRP